MRITLGKSVYIVSGWRLFRTKLKHVLWLEDLKASFIDSTKNVFINPYLPLMEYIQNMTNSKVFCESKIMVMDLSAKILIEMLTKSSLLSRLASSWMILYSILTNDVSGTKNPGTGLIQVIRFWVLGRLGTRVIRSWQIWVK